MVSFGEGYQQAMRRTWEARIMDANGRVLLAASRMPAPDQTPPPVCLPEHLENAIVRGMRRAAMEDLYGLQ